MRLADAEVVSAAEVLTCQQAIRELHVKLQEQTMTSEKPVFFPTIG